MHKIYTEMAPVCQSHGDVASTSNGFSVLGSTLVTAFLQRKAGCFPAFPSSFTHSVNLDKLFNIFRLYSGNL